MPASIQSDKLQGLGRVSASRLALASKLLL